MQVLLINLEFTGIPQICVSETRG